MLSPGASMRALSKEQQDFLRRHKIPISRVFDATGMKKREYGKVMREQEKLLAIGVTPCKREGHALRSRNGNCVQCNPADLAFATRKNKNAYVYISASRGSELLKIGLSQDPEQRESLLNARGYGGVSDWSEICRVRCVNAGKVEFAIHEALAEFASPRSYLRDGASVDCLEIFSCGYQRARQALLDAIRDEDVGPIQERRDASINYNFPDKVGGRSIRRGKQ